MSTLIPWSGGKELDRLRTEMDRLFDRFLDWKPFDRSLGKGEWAPLIDLSETEKEIIVKAEIPGMDAKDIDITLDGRILNIRGEKKAERAEKDETFHRIERSYGIFTRSFELPREVDAGEVKASYDKGVLKITLPKTREQSAKKIDVKTA